MIFSDSLSALQALGKLKAEHPLLIQTQELLHKINADQKEFFFKWVPGHVGIRENEAADRAAKEALDKKIDSQSHAFFGPESFNCQICISNLKFHEILPKLPDKLLSFCNTRKENTVLNILHIGHSHLTHSFISVSYTHLRAHETL